MSRSILHAVLGRPLTTASLGHERLTRPRALGAFGLDALSSVAYGPDEILYVLLLAGAAGVQWDIPVAVAITTLLIIVVTSYRQTIFAYPHGGGSYTVARENLGLYPGLIAAAALMVDYLTTVAVSVTAGVEAILAFAPGLNPFRVPMDVGIILLLMLANLRGIREAGSLFVIPTYIFIGSLGLLVALGIVRLVFFGGLPAAAPPPVATESVTLFLVLRAFAGGCTAMTGVEAVANGVPVFEEPAAKHAASTLVFLAAVLSTLFLGVAALGHIIGAVPTDESSTLAHVGQVVAGGTPLFYVVQISAAVILALAANTSFNGFPLLAAIISRDGYLPHQFQHRGLRLAYSNGIVVLGSLAILLVVVFGGDTHALIPLFAIGVFLCFTLSQAGMVQHWRRTRDPGWQSKLAINGLGAVTTGLVTLIVVASKFTEGAWIVILLVPSLVLLFLGTHSHYQEEATELQEDHPPPVEPRPHLAVIPVVRVNRSTSAALAYARSLGCDVRAVHFVVDEERAEQLRRAWAAWNPGVSLEMAPSPYRELLEPLHDYIAQRVAETPGMLMTVVLPEIVPRHWWEEALHNQTALALEFSLRRTPNVVVSAVPLQLER